MSNKFLDIDGCIKVTMFNNHASKGTESETEKTTYNSYAVAVSY